MSGVSRIKARGDCDGIIEQRVDGPISYSALHDMTSSPHRNTDQE